MHIQTTGSGGAILTVESTNANAASSAKMDIVADSGGANSGNAELLVHSKANNAIGLVKSTASGGQSRFEVTTTGTGGAVLTVQSSHTSQSSHAKLEVLASPASGATSGNAVLKVFSKNQNAISTLKTTGTGGQARMNILS